MSPVEKNAFLILSLVADSEDNELTYNEALKQSGLSKKEFDQAYDYLFRMRYVGAEIGVVALTTEGEIKYHQIKSTLDAKQTLIKEPMPTDPAKVFVVHGRNSK